MFNASSVPSFSAAELFAEFVRPSLRSRYAITVLSKPMKIFGQAGSGVASSETIAFIAGPSPDSISAIIKNSQKKNTERMLLMFETEYGYADVKLRLLSDFENTCL